MASDSDNRRTWFPGCHRGLVDSVDVPISPETTNIEKLRSKNKSHEKDAPVFRGVAHSSTVSAFEAPLKLLPEIDEVYQKMPISTVPLHRKYRTLYEIQFCCSDLFPVAQYISTDSGEPHLVLIKTLTGSNVEEQIQRIQRLQHPRFLSFHEIFSSDGEFKVAFEFMPVSLAELAGNPLIDELVLASIVGQESPHPI